MKNANRLTLQDIAREAGVSMMTVSRVINRKEGVGAETRQLIEDIIRDRGYRPNRVARGLATQRTGTIGLVVPDNSNPFFSEVARAVDRVVYPEGYTLLLCNADEDPQRELDVLELLLEKWVDGLVLCGSRLEPAQLDPLLAQFPAAVLVNRLAPRREGLERVSSVTIDDRRGGRLVTEHLLQAGDRRIGFLSGPPVSQSSRWRLEGYRAALQAAGIPYQAGLVAPCPPTVEGGAAGAAGLLDRQPDLSALFCYNDLVAVGALQTCRERGLDVPRDLRVCGFDDIPLAALVTPALSTCQVDRAGLGSAAAHLLLDQLNDPQAGGLSREIRPELVRRASAP